MFLMAAVVAGIVHNLILQLHNNLLSQWTIYFIAGDPRAPLVQNISWTTLLLYNLVPSWL
jgi:hypothetical protein